MWMQPLALEGHFAEAESAAPFALGENAPQALFDEGFQCGALAVRQLAGLLEEAVRYLYGRFHMASHITGYGPLSIRAFLA